MKLTIALASIMTCLGLMFGSYAAAITSVQEQGGRKAPEVIQLATESKLGTVTFSHVNHTTKNYNVEGTGPIGCVVCHHTEQPASELAKHQPPLKTARPPDRTTTLTADLLEKDPNAPGVIGCQSCHARAGTKPTAIPEIPKFQVTGEAAPSLLTNQKAFHAKCAGCHDEAAKARPTVKAPTSKKCMDCHKRA